MPQRHASRSRTRGGRRNKRSRPGPRSDTLLVKSEFTTREFAQYGAISVFGRTDPLAGGSYSYYFRLADLPNVAQYASLFGLYRVRSIRLSFIPTATMSAVINATEPPGGTNPAYFVPNLHAAIDYVDNTNPTNALQLMGYSSYRRQLMDREMNFTFKPAVSLQASNVGTTTPTLGVALEAPWCAVVDPLLRWGGVRVFVDPCSSGSVALDPLIINVYAAVDIEFADKL